MRRVMPLVAIVLGTLGALPAHAEGEADESTDQLVLLNAANGLGNLGQIDRLRRVLDQRGLLRKLPTQLEAALDGRSVLVHDIEAIKEAYGDTDFATALKIIEQDEDRILKGIASGDPIPALAELSEWRGLIHAAMHKDEEAVAWFRAAYRFNPAWSLEKKYASPSMVSLVKQARREVSQLGKLRIDADPEDATVRVDGGAAQPLGDKLQLPIGYHFVVVSAPNHVSWADLVEIHEGKTEKLPIKLDKADKADRAATLIDATVTAAPGKARLREGKRLLANIEGGRRMLVIEDGNADHVTLRLYDIDTKKVSKPLMLENNMSSASITRLVNAALDPDNMVSASSVLVIDRTTQPKVYERWYFWVGVAAVAVGGFAGYQYMTREPTAVRF
ncbi:MAG: PEGA domain-containing protein [Deltaproteobacteria bacterium]|nr:PEGA domain-containing protein [Deltaproteobacteria bacterium]